MVDHPSMDVLHLQNAVDRLMLPKNLRYCTLLCTFVYYWTFLKTGDGIQFLRFLPTQSSMIPPHSKN